MGGGGEQNLASALIWNPKRNLGVTTHFSEIIKLQFGKESHTYLCNLKLFTNMLINYL